jgi:hypothetical protein
MTNNELVNNEMTEENTIMALPTVDDMKSKAALFNSMNSAGSLADHEGELEIIGITQRPGVQKNMVTGVLEDCTDTTFFGADGKGYFTKSAGIARAARYIISAFGTPDQWPDGKLTVKVVETKLDSKRKMKNLEVVG